jgi:outer membrane protein assembly factor BamA
MLIVQEKGMLSVSPIVSNQDVYGWYAGTGLTFRNVLGYRNKIDIITQLGGLRHFEFRLSNPWIFRKLRLFAEFRIYRTAFRYRFSDHPNHFDERDTGLEMTLGKGIGRKFQVGIRSGFERIWVEDPNVSVESGQTDDIFILEPFLCFDSRDWPLYPKRGIFLQTWIRRFDVTKGYRPERISLDIRGYTPAYRENILAVQTIVEISHGPIPIYKRIHIGGGRTIRGFSTGDLSGENSALLSIEYRIPILYIRNPLAGLHAGYAIVLFSDIASTWDRISDWTSDDIYASVGIGVHAIWDHFVLRGEYGYRGRGLGFINVGTGVKF